MRNLLVFLTCTVLAASAHANTIDDFVLTGQGHTIEYSVPATTTTPDFSVFNFFYLQSSATIDGVSGYTLYGSYYVISPGVNLVIGNLPSSIFGTSLLAFAGPYLSTYTLEPASNPFPYLPFNVVATFTPGTYSLRLSNSNPFDPASYDYSLTITPEAPSAATPEPSTVALFLTGCLGLFALARGRVIRNTVQRA